MDAQLTMPLDVANLWIPADSECIRLDGVTPSSRILEDYRGKPMLLAFSRGKDSIAAWIAMVAHGIEVCPYFLYDIPGLRFVEESLTWFEEFFNTRILRLPSLALMRRLGMSLMQPPHRTSIINEAQLWQPDYPEIDKVAYNWFEFDQHGDAHWSVDGVRAADSLDRRTGIATHGPIRDQRVHGVWDWRHKHVWHAIETAQIPLPVDYAMNKRSFDGIDYQYIAPLLARYPDDYATVMRWFPLADLDIFRRTRLSRTDTFLQKGVTSAAARV